MMVAAAKLDRGKPESIIRMSKQTAKNFENPETQRKHKAATKAGWQDPVKRANHLAGYNTPEARENRRAGAVAGHAKRRERIRQQNLTVIANAKASLQSLHDKTTGNTGIQ